METAAKRTHYKQVDYLRGIAMCLVILCHSVIVYPINLCEDYTWYLLHEFTRYMCMPMFFVVSGFCFGYKGHYGNYIWKKIQRVAIPHFVFGAIDLIPRIIPNPLVHQQADWRSALADFFLTGGSDWFLPTLFNIFLIFPLIHVVYQKGKGGKLVAYLAVAAIYLCQSELTENFMIRMSALNLLYFMAGYVTRQAFTKEKVQEALKSIPAMCLGAAIMLGMLFWMEHGSKWVGIESFGALGGTVFFYGIACRVKGVLAKCLDEISKYSLQIFLMGGYALVFTRTLMVMVLGVQIPIVIILFNFFVDLLITWLMSRFILDRFKLFRMVSGL
ncbi:MAG: acyltransferase [Lachnospiraceae bacterium]|nr:acyltransferase [Lachnospiraceae bacterium]